MSRLPLELLQEGRRLGNRPGVRREDQTICVVDSLNIQRLRCCHKDCRITLFGEEEVLENDLELRCRCNTRGNNSLLVPRRNPALHIVVASLRRLLSAIKRESGHILLVNINVDIEEEELRYGTAILCLSDPLRIQQRLAACGIC